MRVVRLAKSCRTRCGRDCGEHPRQRHAVTHGPRYLRSAAASRSVALPTWSTAADEGYDYPVHRRWLRVRDIVRRGVTPASARVGTGKDRTHPGPARWLPAVTIHTEPSRQPLFWSSSTRRRVGLLQETHRTRHSLDAVMVVTGDECGSHPFVYSSGELMERPDVNAPMREADRDARNRFSPMQRVCEAHTISSHC